MGLEREDIDAIVGFLNRLDRREELLILGDAVIHCDGAELRRAAGRHSYPIIDPPEELEPFSLGRSLGFRRTETLDINGNASITLDLHGDPPDELVGVFDCIIDAGVLFWCSDPGAALRTILRIARVGGLIIHVAALSGYYGRGYYDIHPLLFEDFYLMNGCEFVISTARTRYRPRGLLGRVASRLRGRKEVTVNREPGNVYLSEGRLNRIAFSNRYADGREPNMLPNNAVGLFAFQKQRQTAVSMPVRSTAYEPGEREKDSRVMHFRG